jgi:hypothetical protein
MAMAVALVGAPCVTLPRLTSLHPSPKTSRDAPARGWAPLAVRGIATGPPKSATEVEWKVKREALKKNNLRSVKLREALRLQQEQGYTILDVRTEAEFAEAHAAGAVNAQLYRLIKEWTPWEFSKSLGALQCFLAHRFRAAACFFCHFSRFFFLVANSCIPLKRISRVCIIRG